MTQNITIGKQDFEKIRTEHCFYIDKTNFIKQWWEKKDDVTLIARPRRFGKTLNMSMVEQFFSIQYENRGELFEGLSIWEEEKYQKLQGTYPVISLSFANVKEKSFEATREKICRIVSDLYDRYHSFLDSEILTQNQKDYIRETIEQKEKMNDVFVSMTLHHLSQYLYEQYGKKVIILLDEYDTPMQEAYVNGYWEELVGFMRSLFNATFKTNPYLERAIMTGIVVAPSSLGSKKPRQVCEVGFPTKLQKTSLSSQCQSILSDLNNLKVITTTSNEYATSFGFTEQEVFRALEDFGYADQKQYVKEWYDGFVFGEQSDIYNPWSITNFLDTGKFAPYWANTSSNSLIGKLIKESDYPIKMTMEDLLTQKSFFTELDEQIIFSDLDENENAIWSLLVASGYLKVQNVELNMDTGACIYELKITNKEVSLMFQNMIKGWFSSSVKTAYNDFIKALLQDDLDAMNEYMNDIAVQIFSSFDTGKNPSKKQQPERFYHGFVLGLLVDLRNRYIVTSNRESGFGRYDVVLEPLEEGMDAIILEFKVHKSKREATLEDTVKVALRQIEEKGYAADLIAKGISKDRIRSYGFAFDGKVVLIG